MITIMTKAMIDNQRIRCLLNRPSESIKYLHLSVPQEGDPLFRHTRKKMRTTVLLPQKPKNQPGWPHDGIPGLPACAPAPLFSWTQPMPLFQHADLLFLSCAHHLRTRSLREDLGTFTPATTHCRQLIAFNNATSIARYNSKHCATACTTNCGPAPDLRQAAKLTQFCLNSGQTGGNGTANCLLKEAYSRIRARAVLTHCEKIADAFGRRRRCALLT